MKKTIASAVMAAWILTCGLSRIGRAASVGSSEDRATVVVYVRNYAQLDRKTLTRAGQAAQYLLRKTGIEFTFVPIAPDERHQVGVTQGNLNLSLKVLSREMTEKLGLPTTLMGLTPGEGGDRTEAFVFADKAVELARKQADPGLAEILGHAMAHEIGHLFNLTHCAHTIMHGDWDKRDLNDMVTDRLNFSSEQAAQIRAELARRIRQSQTVEIAQLR